MKHYLKFAGISAFIILRIFKSLFLICLSLLVVAISFPIGLMYLTYLKFNGESIGSFFK